MKRNVLIISILILALLGVGLVYVFGNFGSNTDQGVVLEASASKASYISGEEVSFNINLTNSSKTNVCLSEGAIGNIKFKSFIRDGETLETRLAPSYFLTSFSEILKSRLVAVAPGGSLEFNLTSSFDPGLGVQALSTTVPDDTSGLATFYNVEKLGKYEIELVYEYVAEPSDDCQDILSGPTNTATVVFTIE